METKCGGRAGQGAVEYLLIIGGAAAVLAILVMIVLSQISAGGAATNCDFEAAQRNIALPPSGVNITSPTACYLAKLSATGVNQNLIVDFNFGSLATSYDINVSKQGGGTAICLVSGTPIVYATDKGGKQHTCSGISNPPAGTYDINVTVFTSAGVRTTDFAKGSVIVK